AAIVAASIRNRALKPVAFGTVLAFSLSAEITEWDGAILSESLSVSLLALLVGGWLWLLERPAWRQVALVAVVGAAWALARESDAYVELTLVPVLAVAAGFGYATRQLAVVAIATLLVFGANQISVDASRRWERPFLNVIAQRILPRPQRTE